MTSENVAEQDPVESAVAMSVKTVDNQLIEELVSRAQAGGVQLTGEGGLLQQLTKRLLESALEGEITDHLGYDKHDPAGRNGGNSRKETRSKTVLTDVGPVEIAVPRDRDGWRCHIIGCVGLWRRVGAWGGAGFRAGAQASAGWPAARVIWSQMAKRMVISAR
ncbi:hypothetical protein SUDANB176_00017 [Streptomyces sp. enrichment culture]